MLPTSPDAVRKKKLDEKMDCDVFFLNSHGSTKITRNAKKNETIASFFQHKK